MSRRDQPYLPLYVMDFLTDEKLRECSAESVGVYIMLMCVMHKQEEYGTIVLREKDRKSPDTIADFAAKLAKHLPFGEEVIGRAIRELIGEGVLCEDDDRLIQKRMVRDADISEKRASAGKKGSTATNIKFDAAKQAAKGPAKPGGGAGEQPSKAPGRRKRASILSAEQQALFERFYAAYPKKIDPAAAERAWAKITPPPDQEMTDKIIKAVEDAKRFDSRFRDRQYIPNPASWLNARGYLSEYTRDGGINHGSDTNRGGSGGQPGDPGAFKPSGGFKGN